MSHLGSVWTNTVEEDDIHISRRKSNSLKRHIDVDVCVVGAGISGVTSAYMLAKRGKRVALIDSGDLGAGVTGDTTAQITWRLDDDYKTIVDHYGLNKTKMIAESHRSAIEMIAQIVHDEHIDCNFERVNGYQFTDALKKNNEDRWDDELETIRKMGFSDVHRLSSAPIDGKITGPCIEFVRQAQFHPLRYVFGVYQAFLKNGGQFYSNTKVTKISGDQLLIIDTESGGEITARSLIVATHSPINNLFTMHTKQAPYQSYVIAMRIPRYGHPYALYWDDQEPYHYVNFISAADHDLILVGGEDHKTGQDNHPEQHFQSLEEWGRERFPQAGKVEFKWTNQVFEPIDRIGFIGRNPGNKNIYIATGFSGNGMTYGTIAGMLLSDMVLGKKNAWEEIYNPSRIPVHAAAEFAKENFNVAWQMCDWVKGGEVGSIDEIPNDEGAIVSQGLKKMAVYKDEDGRVIQLSAKCTHLGCMVHWNTTAKTWDCPCHGSRFNCHGEVIAGPATKDLQEISEEENLNTNEVGVHV
jgi:glycine/D-amino acid oxidase-like deaminating enzyme/nitrite reductase/ring-hydroxylating ferredoxin subunit